MRWQSLFFAVLFMICGPRFVQASVPSTVKTAEGLEASLIKEARLVMRHENETTDDVVLILLDGSRMRISGYPTHAALYAVQGNQLSLRDPQEDVRDFWNRARVLGYDPSQGTVVVGGLMGAEFQALVFEGRRKKGGFELVQAEPKGKPNKTLTRLMGELIAQEGRQTVKRTGRLASQKRKEAAVSLEKLDACISQTEMPFDMEYGSFVEGSVKRVDGLNVVFEHKGEGYPNDERIYNLSEIDLVEVSMIVEGKPELDRRIELPNPVKEVVKYINPGDDVHLLWEPMGEDCWERWLSLVCFVDSEEDLP